MSHSLTSLAPRMAVLKVWLTAELPQLVAGAR